MSLKEAYSMAHSAQCRLHMAASEPDRNLRFVVGHLMHYEALRLRIVEIEHDISKNERASAVAFKGTGHVNQSSNRLLQKPSTGSLRKKSPPPPPVDDDDDDDGSDGDPWSGDEDNEDSGDLSLERFPSGSAAPPRPPPDLMPDVENPYGDDDEDELPEPLSPEEPDQETLEAAMKGPGNADYATLYDSVRKCTCHKQQDAPTFENFWELPAVDGQKEGVTRAVAQVYA